MTPTPVVRQDMQIARPCRCHKIVMGLEYSCAVDGCAGARVTQSKELYNVESYASSNTTRVTPVSV
jgi:hypothetical protein